MYKSISSSAYPTDTALVEALFRREETALEEAGKRYGSLLKRMSSRFLTDPRDREEAESDALLKLWHAIPPHRPESLPAFLTTLMRRSAIDRQRHISRAGAIPPDCLAALDELAEILPDHRSTEDQVMARELGRSLSGFLEGLEGRRREIFLRRYYGSEKVKDMAKAMDLSSSTVEKELKALRLELKKKLESEGYTL